jgi:hypothetical protein
MGWGTFIAGRVLRKRSHSESEPVFIPAMAFLAGKFYESYLNKIYANTIAVNQADKDLIDMNAWEEGVHSRAKKDWYALLVVLLVVNIFWILAGAFFGFIFSPLIWYYVKHRMIKRAIKEINDSTDQTKP